MSSYIKALLAIAVSLGGAAVTALDGDATISLAEGLGIAIFVLGSGGVTWLVSKTAGGKAIVAALSASLTSLVAAVVTDSFVTTQEWITALVAGLVSLSLVYRIPNAESSPEPPL